MRAHAFVAAAVVTGCLLAASQGCNRNRSSPSFGAGTTRSGATSVPEVVFQIGPGVPAAVASRAEALVHGATSRSVRLEAAGTSLGPLASGSLVIALGDTRSTRGLVTAAEVAALGSEGFILRSRSQAGVTTIATDGPGVRFGAYALLEELGFAFLHPLAPTRPAELATPAATIDRTEEPRWPFRGIHLHTMHPLELTELLNGWGPGGPNDAAGFASMLPEWDLFCEWAVANKLNRVEWFLLSATSWQTFAESATRQGRLAELVARAHAWGLQVGVDVPIALRQQHAWRMIESFGNRAQELAQIRARVAWLHQVGFDFIGTEMGTSEFTPTDDREMVAWMDELAASTDALGMRCYVKAHCSTGQFAKNYTDPLNGGKLNYNFLARVADPRMGVYPHTVQVYGLDDPAPTYGNQDFDYVRTFLQEEAGRREVVWHPETAYWVSYDVDVPLFLPLYAERRVHDLRLIASDERQGKVGRGTHAGTRIDGQMTFSSGWEWGYWLNDVIAARASWDPHESAASDEAALDALLEPVVRALGGAGDEVRRELLALCREQNELLIRGRVNGVAPSAVERRNGIGYLQGWETFDDLACALDGIIPLHETQPAKLGLIEMRTAPLLGKGPSYSKEVEPLLAAMEATFAARATALDLLRAKAPASGRPLLDDMADAAAMTALRAKQVRGLYEYVAASMARRSTAKAHLQDARDALDAALLVVKGREAQYRVPADRIAAWRDNPTSYAFTYLWTVRSLHFWWRDEVKAVDLPLSPFEMNIIDPIDVALGENALIPMAKAARAWGNQKGLSWLVAGLAEPASEPIYLPDGPNGVRKRP